MWWRTGSATMGMPQKAATYIYIGFSGLALGASVRRFSRPSEAPLGEGRQTYIHIHCEVLGTQVRTLMFKGPHPKRPLWPYPSEC